MVYDDHDDDDACLSSGAGPNSKVGGTCQTQSYEKFCIVPSSFFPLQVQSVVLVSAFVMVSTVWSLSCFLFLYSRCPLCPVICKSGDTCPCALWRHFRGIFSHEKNII